MSSKTHKPDSGAARSSGHNRATYLDVGGQRVAVIRKKTSRVRLSVLASSLQIRATVPQNMPLIQVRYEIMQRREWIDEQLFELLKQVRSPGRQYVSNERLYFEGRRYKLFVDEVAGPDPWRISFDLDKDSWLVMRVPLGADRVAREKFLFRFYRDWLKVHISEVVAEWEPLLGVHVKDWRVRRVKKTWVTISPKHQGVWLNSELAKMPIPCFEYYAVRGMLFLKHAGQKVQVEQSLDRLLPDWRLHHDEVERIWKADCWCALQGPTATALQ